MRKNSKRTTWLWNLSTLFTGADARLGLVNVADSFAILARVKLADHAPERYRKRHPLERGERAVGDDALSHLAMLDALHARGLLVRTAEKEKPEHVFAAVLALAARRLRTAGRKTFRARGDALATTAPGRLRDTKAATSNASPDARTDERGWR